MELLFDDVWASLKTYWEYGPRHIACAYFSSDQDLSFGEGDVLVVDATEASIRAGRTDAFALRRAVESGASVYSFKNLHAKVYVLGSWCAIGSANSSQASRNLLTECMVLSDDPHLVAEGISFVGTLSEKSVKVDEAFLAKIEAIKVERKGGALGVRRDDLNFRKPRCWLVGTYPAIYPGNRGVVDSENEKAQEGFSQDGFDVDWFWWEKNNSKFSREARVGDLVVQISTPVRNEPDERKIFVYKHAPICGITEEPGVRAKAYHVAWRSDHRETAIDWGRFNALLARIQWGASLSKNSCREIPDKFSRLLSANWS